MRSHEERVAETKRRIAKIEREKQLRRNTVTMASAVAACLALLIGASLAMPGIAAKIQAGDYSGFETAASIFHGGAALGYIVIGLLAFLLPRSSGVFPALSRTVWNVTVGMLFPCSAAVTSLSGCR